MTRVVAGSAGGRKLLVPRGRDTRPTSERAREGLFSTLEAMLGTLSGCSFLDLYAGSGAVGLEAASRGAERVLLIESAGTAVTMIRRNAESLDLRSVEIRADHVEQALTASPPQPFDIAFLDPPYANAVEGDLTALVANGWLTSDAVVVVERASRDSSLVWPAGLAADRSRRYGDGMLWYGRRS